MSERVWFWDRLPLSEGAKIANVGFGSDAELISLSRTVGQAGFVFGIERSRKLVEKTAAKLVDIRNVRLIAADADRIPIREDSVDAVLFKGVLHEVKNVRQALLEASRISKNEGAIMIIDFSIFPKGWLRRSNLRWWVYHPWKILEPPLDVWPGFSEENIRVLLEKARLRLERYEGNLAQGRFSGHPVPMFLATTTVHKSKGARAGETARNFLGK